MKIVFAGTPDFAVAHLKCILESGFDVCAVYTQPDRPKGRGHKLQPSPVKELAQAHNIKVFQPESLKKDPNAIAEFKKLDADLLVVVAYGLILPDDVINAPKIGTINVHGSLLPKWRGAAPIQRSLWAGDTQTGVTIMKICPKLDAGDILSTAKIDIENTDTSESLYNKLAVIGPKALVDAIHNIRDLLTNATPQNEAEATYAEKLTKEEARINWQLPADIIERYIRAYIPWPVAYFPYANENIKLYAAKLSLQHTEEQPGTILKVVQDGILVACGNGSTLLLTKMQFPGKKVLSFKDIFNAKKELFVVKDILD